MNGRNYGYQYDTNPRKIKPDYSRPKRNKTQMQKSKTTKSRNAKSNAKKTKQVKQTKQSKQKEQKKLQNKAKFSVFIKCILLFAILFFVIFRNSQISESFAEIQSLKATISEIKKENNQLEINIQNSINLSNIEQQAKELLGMQKLNNKQIEYISLPKKDYTEPKAEEVIIDDEKSLLDIIIEKITNLF